MNELNTEQKRLLYEVIKREKPELMPLLDVLDEISAGIRAIASKEEPINERPEVQKVALEGVELVTIRGKDLKYEDLTDEQKAELKGKQGDKGDNYILTDEDRKAIAKTITVPVVEKIIEKIEVIHEQPVVTNEIKEVAVADTAEQVRDKLETLKEDERLDKKAIKGLEEMEKEIATIKATPRGGGVSALAVRQAFKYIFHTEKPAGVIDGANVAYTVQNEIFAVISFSLNGETVAQLPNYTVSGRTITFGTALPAVYSGKDFEVKYIG